MKWWKILLIVFLIGIVAILGAWAYRRPQQHKEGFQTTPITLPTSISKAYTGTDKKYYILDLTLPYIQSQMLQFELPLRKDAVLADETTNFTITDKTHQQYKRIQGYFRILQWPDYMGYLDSDKIDKTDGANQYKVDIKRREQYLYGIFTPAVFSLNIDSTKYQAAVLNQIRTFYDGLYGVALNHPIGYILSDIDNYTDLNSFINLTTSIDNSHVPADVENNTLAADVYMIGSDTSFNLSPTEESENKANWYIAKRCYYNKGYYHAGRGESYHPGCTNDDQPSDRLCIRKQYMTWAWDGCPAKHSRAPCSAGFCMHRFLFNTRKLSWANDFTYMKQPKVVELARTPIPTTLLTSPDTWGLTKKITNNATLDSIENQKIGKSMWREIDYVGTISATNTTEINKSILYSVYFNFSNSSYDERQMRVAPNAASVMTLYMSPTFRAVPEYTFRVTNEAKSDASGNPQGIVMKNIKIERDISGAVANNNIHCAVEMTADMFKHLPYHARNYIARWADARLTRLEQQKTPTPDVPVPEQTKYATIVVGQNPVFNMLTILTTADQFNIEKKKLLMDKMAQCYYDLAPQEKSIKKFYDIYQIGETIFDAKFEIQEKTSPEFRDKINQLTENYLRLRRMPMSLVDLAKLEQNYQESASALYEKENRNIEGQGDNCSIPDARSVRYIDIETTTAGASLYLSQIIVINNFGANVAQGARITTPSGMGYLYSGEIEDTQILRFNVAGSPLTPAENGTYCANKNASKGKLKLELLTDGLLYPRVPPNIYRTPSGTYSATPPQGGSPRTITELDTATTPRRFIRVDLGYQEQIVAVKLVFPAVQMADGTEETAYKVSLRDSANPNKEPNTNVIRTITRPANRSPERASFLETDSTKRDVTCPTDYVSRVRTARFYATITGDGRTAAQPDISKIAFTGYSESDNPIETPALSFNPRYNCGFDIATDTGAGSIESQSPYSPSSSNRVLGNNVYAPKTLFKRNFDQQIAAGGAYVNCADTTKIKDYLTEYRVSQVLPGGEFAKRPDIVNLNYDLENSYYYPSSVHFYAQVNPSTCAYIFKELRLSAKTNQLLDTVDRYGKLVFMPDVENWYSPKILYNIPSSMMFASRDSLQTNIGANKPLVALAQAVSVPLPLPPKRVLDNGIGSCPERTCADIDVINTLVVQYNNVSTTVGLNPRQILRVNRAATVAANQCDYEVIMGDYKTAAIDTTETTFTSSISLFTKLDPATCQYKLDQASFGFTQFAAAPTAPLLSRIYTYAADYLAPIYKSINASLTSIGDIASVQLDGTKETITKALGTYRTDVLSAYGALKQLEGCTPNDTTNRCYDPSILSQFIDTYSASPTANSGSRLRQILRAATASATECDFTFETEALSVRAGGSVGGTVQTVGMRCSMKKDPYNCNFSIDTEAYKSEEVYSINRNSMFNFDEAANTCRALKGRLATYNELAHAFRMGANWCNAGWIADSDTLYNPNQSTITNTCGPTVPRGLVETRILPPGISTLFDYPDRRTLRAAANCIGVKPTTFPTGVIAADFSAGRPTMPISTQGLQGGCMWMMPAPPSAEDLRDLGYQPTTASITATISTMSTTLGSGQTMVRAAATSPLDYINCASDYALAALVERGITPFAITRAENIDPTTCAYNGTATGYKFIKDPARGVFTYSATAQVSPVVANQVAFNRGATWPALSLSPAVATDADCMRSDLKNAIGAPVYAAKRVDARTCEYRMTPRDDVPFAATYKRISFFNDGVGTSISALRPGDPATSLFKYSPSLATSLNTAAVFQTISTVSKRYWNSKFYDSIVASERQFRGPGGRLSTVGTYQNRIGKISQVGYIPAEDSVVLTARNATYGPNGERDVRTYAANQYFKLFMRNSFADPTKTVAYRMDRIDPITGLQLTEVSDPDTSVRSSAELITPASNLFRFVRLRIDTPSQAEITRINFYKGVLPSATPYKCGTTTTPTLTLLPTDNAYATITDYDGNELYLPSYTPAPNEPCIGPFTREYDFPTGMSTCLLKANMVEANNRDLYTYPKGSQECRVGYTELRDTTPISCRLTYNFSEILGEICKFAPADSAKRLKLDTRQYLVIDFGEFISFDGYSILTGSGLSSRLPTGWTLEASVNAATGQWVEISKVSAFNWGGANDGYRNFLPSPIFKLFDGGQTQIDVPSLPSRLNRTTGLTEAFVVPAAAAERPSWMRITVLETQDPKSRFVSMGALQFITPSETAIDSKQIQVSNFGSSRRSPKEGPDALLDIGSGRVWTDYARAPLIFRLPLRRDPIKTLRYAVPGTKEGMAALPKRMRVEGSWDGRTWTLLEENTYVPPGYTGYHAFYRFQKPF